MTSPGAGKDSRSPGRKNTSPSARVTVREVAAAAGVSVGTVSHVVSGRRRVAEATRARVEAAIEALGYRPNRLARSLQARRTHTLAMVIPDVGNPFFGELARAVEREARSADYCVVFGNSENDPDLEARYVDEFIERRVDGLIVVVAGAAAWVRRLPADLPVVALDRYPARWPLDAVLVDNREGIEAAVAHLTELGHRRLGFVGGDARLTTGRERARGFTEALARRHLRPAWSSRGVFSLESGRRQTEELLALPRAERPTAVVVANDLLALGTLLACRAAGISVPEELSVVGFDDIPFAAIAHPALTTIRQPIDELGTNATRLLLGRIAGWTSGPPRRLTVRPSLVVRASTAPPAEEAAPLETVAPGETTESRRRPSRVAR